MLKNGLAPVEVAKFYGVGLAAVYAAIKSGRLKAYIENGRWCILRESLHEYAKTRYCRSISRYNGELVYDKAKGEYSIAEAAKLVKAKVNYLYHACRNGELPHKRKGCAYVVHIDDIHKFKETYKK